MTRARPRRAADRGPSLNEQRNRKMARSAHAYVRGSTDKFYEWLVAQAPHSLPEGPPVWICGDCHLGNMGPVADASGRVDALVRDFDQTVVGNPAHDLIRLALSLTMAARGCDLSGVTAARMLENMVDAYGCVCDGRDTDADGRSRVLQMVLADARRRRWRHLARERSGGDVRRLPENKRFWPLLAQERRAIAQLVSQPEIARLATTLERRSDEAHVQVLDAAYWVKGCSSLGRARYAVLLDVGGEARRDRDFCLIDIKEAARALAPRNDAAEMPRDNGERVVAGARAMSPFLGERMRASRLLGRSVVIRELLPEDLKFGVEHLAPGEAVKVARALAAVVARGHTRQMTDDERAAWGRELGRNHSKSLEMPSWLWSSVVELIAAHERAYLEHCRRLAAAKARH